MCAQYAVSEKVRRRINLDTSVYPLFLQISLSLIIYLQGEKGIGKRRSPRQRERVFIIVFPRLQVGVHSGESRGSTIWAIHV